MSPALRAAVLAAAAIPAGLLAQTQPAPQPPREIVSYSCETRVTNPGGIIGDLTVRKSFREDGSVVDQMVQFSGQGNFVRNPWPADTASVHLRWPSGRRFLPGGVPAPFSWGDGSIRVDVFTPATYTPRRREVWVETIVDRGNNVQLYEERGDRLLLPMISELQLTSGLSTQTGSGALNASIDNLLAWSHGVERLRVYYLWVERAPFRRNVSGNDPGGRRRIAAQFEIHVGEFERVVGELRRTATAIEAGFGDFRRCQRQVSHPDENEVIITSG